MFLCVACSSHLLQLTVLELASSQDEVDVVHHLAVQQHVAVGLVTLHKYIAK